MFLYEQCSLCIVFVWIKKHLGGTRMSAQNNWDFSRGVVLPECNKMINHHWNICNAREVIKQMKWKALHPVKLANVLHPQCLQEMIASLTAFLTIAFKPEIEFCCFHMVQFQASFQENKTGHWFNFSINIACNSFTFSSPTRTLFEKEKERETELVFYEG